MDADILSVSRAKLYIITFFLFFFIAVPLVHAKKSYHFSPSHGSRLVFKELLLKVQLNQHDINEVTMKTQVARR